MKKNNLAKKTANLLLASGTKISSIFFAGIAMTVAGGLVTAVTHSGPGSTGSDERFPASAQEGSPEGGLRPGRKLITPPLPAGIRAGSRSGSEAASEMASQLARAAEDRAAQNANAPQPDPVSITPDSAPAEVAGVNPGQAALASEDRAASTNTSVSSATGTATPPNTNGYGASVNGPSSTDTSTDTATDDPIYPSGPAQVNLVTSTTAWANVCQIASLSLVDFTGSPAGALNPMTITLATDQGSFYSDAGCVSATTSFSMGAGSSSGIVYFKTTATASVSASEPTVGESDLTITTAQPAAALSLAAATAPAASIAAPNGALRINGKLVVADTSNNRVLIWNSVPATAAQPADIVLGQPDLVSTTLNYPMNTISGTSLAGPTAVASDGTRLAVVDTGNHRVLLWDSFPTTTRQGADHVVGQANMAGGSANRAGAVGAGTLSSPSCALFSSGALFVCDKGNHRVLGWASVPNTNPTAAAVFAVGQLNLTSAATGNGLGQMHSPTDATVANGKLFVSDSGNDRVLVWATVPSAALASASFAMGGTGATSALTLSAPEGVRLDNQGRVFISDTGNHRVLVWNQAPVASGVAADGVIGQTDLNSRLTGAASTSLDGPTGLEVTGSELWIADTLNNRVLQFTLP